MAKMYNRLAKIMLYKGRPVHACKKDEDRWPGKSFFFFP